MNRTLLYFAGALLLIIPTASFAMDTPREYRESATSHDPSSPLHERPGIIPLQVLDGETCFSADASLVGELGDGSVYLQYIDRYIGDITIVFGKDLRESAGSIVQGDAGTWNFCFDIFIHFDELGDAEPHVRTRRFTAPDMSM